MGSVLDKIDWKKLSETMKDASLTALSGVLEGAQDDLQSFGTEIGTRIATALQITDEGIREDIIQENLAQLEVIAEINRVRVINTTWTSVNVILQALWKSALAVVGAML